MNEDEEVEDEERESLYDAFDEMLEARFHGREFDPSGLLAEQPSLSDEIEAASRLAQDVVAPSTVVMAPEIAGYRIVQEIGHGGMGTVYLAIQEKLDRRVAIKVLSPSLALSRRSRQRFLAEAQALARLTDDHIVEVHDIFDEGGVLAYAMEWVEGRSLRQLLQGLRHRGLSPQEIDLSDLARELVVDEGSLEANTPLQFWLQTGVTIARALQQVHQAGIVHRDVKPGNILIRKNGQALLADFGLARSGDSSMSMSTGFVGTPIYASPEQLRADEQDLDWDDDKGSSTQDDEEPGQWEVDHRSDIYALAVTLYEVLTGRPPFRGQTTAAVLLRITTGQAERLRSAAPGMPRDLEIVLEKAMDPDPALRYQSAGELADDLERVLNLEPIHARRLSWSHRVLRAAKRNRRTLLAAGIGASLVLVLATAWILREGRERQRPIQIAALRRQAHLELLRPEVRQATWLDLVRKEVDPEQFERAQEARRRAQALYQEALALEPASKLSVESSALDLILRLPDIAREGLDPAEIRSRYPELGEVHSLVLRILTRKTWIPTGDAWSMQRAVSIRLASPAIRPGAQDVEQEVLEARRTWGLLGFLGGAHEICEDCWRLLDQNDWDLPMIDVALSQIYMQDGRPALALQRLQRALRLFPELQDLQLDLAGLAIELEDPRTAFGVLRRMTPDVRRTRTWKILQARALAIKSPEKARPRLESLLQQAPEDPAIRAALAGIALRLGETDEARLTLQTLVEDYPHNPRNRLMLARAALRLGRADDYLAQVRYVVASKFGLFRSGGETRDLLDILQIGGLRRLYDHAVAFRHRYGSPDSIGVSDDFWQGRGGWSSREAVEAAFLPRGK